RLARLQLQLALLEREPAPEEIIQDCHRRADEDENGNQFAGMNHSLPPLTTDRESISCARRWGWSVMIRSIVSMRSLTEPSSARSWAFSPVSSLMRSLASLSVWGCSGRPQLVSSG